MRIIIVEDEIKIREGMAKLIEKHSDHQIVGEAKNGKEGLVLILRFKPDLIITDIRMPIMDGLEMLTKLNEYGIKIHSVILSGYSEFEYAKKAIRLGVNDYLLKPIDVDDVRELLDKIDQRIVDEMNALKGTPQSCIRDIILGSTEYSDEAIKTICKFKDNMKYMLFLGYVGAANMTYSNDYLERVEMLKRRFPFAIIYTIPMAASREIITLVAGDFSYEEVKEYFEKRIILSYYGKEERLLWCVDQFNDRKELPLVFNKLQKMTQYGVTLHNDIMITEELISKLEPDEYNYPIAIENQIKIAICNGNNEKVKMYAQKFYSFMKKKSYEPDCVVDGYMRLYTYTINLLQEIDTKTYEMLRGINTLKLIGDAKTNYELEEAYSDVVRLMENTREKREDIRNYTIKRAINFIREHYKEGITLEEVARKLEITPEYLSTLFNKEVGINFSAFLKDFRLSKAKRLLKGTDMRVYEISEVIGYSDSKYFNRVFKEKFGVSPGEFRQ